MLNQPTRDGISFEGVGKVKIQYHKYTDNTFADIVGKIVENLKAQGKNIGANIKEALLNESIINESGDLITFAPKRVVISEGKDYFDEKAIQNADFVFLKGGQLDEKLTAKVVSIANKLSVEVDAKTVNLLKGHDTSGLINANELRARDTKISNPQNIQAKTVYLFNSSIDGLKFEGDLKLYGKSVANDSTANYITAKDKSTVSNSTANIDIYLNNNSVLNNSVANNNIYAYESSLVVNSNANNIEACGNSKVYNSTANNIKAYGNSKVFDSTAENYIKAYCSSRVYNSTADNIYANGNSKVFDSTAKSGIFANFNSTVSNSTAKEWHVNVDSGKNDNVTLDGKIQGKFVKVGNNVSFGPNINLDDVAKNSLPINNDPKRLLLKSMPSYGMTV